MPLYILYSISALILFSISIILFRLNAKYSMPNPKAYFFWYFVIYGLLGLSLPLFNHIQIIPADIKLLKFNLPYAFFISIGIYCFAHAVYKLDVTTMGPLSSMFAFAISRFNKKFLEYHPLKTYLIRFIGIATMTAAVIKLTLGR